MKLGYIQRPVAVIMITLGLVVFGVISLFRLPQELLPNLNEPTLTIETEFADASPKEVERLITKKLEKSLGTLSGLKQMESFSQPSKSIIKVRFGWTHDIEQAIQQVRESTNRIKFPRKVTRPKIMRFDPSMDPIARISFSSKVKGSIEIREILDQNIRPVLETYEGVATTIIKGGFEEEIAILFRRGQMEEFGLKPAEIVAKLQSENISLPTGKFERGEKEIFVRVKSRFSDVRSLGTLVVKRHEGRLIKLSDIAQINVRTKEPETLTRRDGGDAVFLDIYKEADANIIKVVDGLRLAVDEKLVRFKWMRNIKAEIVTDESTFIRHSISNVVSAALGGALLAIIVLYLFIGELVPSFLIGVSIPLVIPVTFFLLDKHGISLNVMSLGGLALGVGMLVDNSIVVLENIAKKSAEKMSILQSAASGTNEMLLPVLASTATTVAVFAPLAFVEGVAGQLFGDLAWTIIYSLSCSLAVAIVVLPTLYVLVHAIGKSELAQGLVASSNVDISDRKFQYWAVSRPYWSQVRENSWEWFRDSRYFYLQGIGKIAFGPIWILFKALSFVIGDVVRISMTGIWLLLSGGGFASYRVLKIAFFPVAKIAVMCRSFVNSLENTYYPAVIQKALDRKTNVLVGLLVLGAIALLLGSQLGGNLLPPLSNSRFFLDGELPLGAGIRTTSTTSFAFEQKLKQAEGISNVVALIGIDQAQALIGNAGINKFSIQFDVDVEKVDMETLNADFSAMTGVNWSIQQRSLGVQSQPLEIIITDNDLNRLRTLAVKLKLQLDAVEFLVPTKDTVSNGVPELTVRLLPGMIGPLGLTPNSIVSDLSHYLRGENATDIELVDRTLPVVVKAAETDIRAANDLSGIKILTNKKHAIDLGSIADISRSVGPSYIFHTAGSRSIRLSYRPHNSTLKDAAAMLEEILPKSTLQTDYRVEGQSEEYQESVSSLLFALSLAVFMVYLVMASQFESFTQPLFIMGTIPLAFIGVVFMIFPFDIPISVMVLVGCIVLVGIVVNNAIIFIDTSNRLRKEGMPTQESVIETGKRRLRPILMTTTTTILGLIPMALATGEGAALSVAMARTIIGGLGFGTLLTLIFIPVLIMIFTQKQQAANQAVG